MRDQRRRVTSPGEETAFQGLIWISPCKTALHFVELGLLEEVFSTSNYIWKKLYFIWLGCKRQVNTFKKHTHTQVNGNILLSQECVLSFKLRMFNSKWFDSIWQCPYVGGLCKLPPRADNMVNPAPKCVISYPIWVARNPWRSLGSKMGVGGAITEGG